MRHVDVALDDQEFAQIAARAREAGVSPEEWVRRLIRQAALPAQPSDPLFGSLADEPELADAIDAVVAERSHRALRTP